MSKLIDSRLVGNSIKSLRLKYHLTQNDLADKVGYSVRNLRRIENFGTNNIDIVNLFASVFNVSALDILEGDVFFISNKKSIVDLRHTILTLICYSYTCTLG